MRFRLAALGRGRLPAALLVATVGGLAVAGGRDFWRFETPEDFFAGESDGVSIGPEGQVRLAPALHTDDLPASGLRVVIGNEHNEPFLHPYAAIMSAYGPAEDDSERGAVVALGPTRMDYAAAIPAVRYLGELLSNMAETLGTVYRNREYV